jgi:tetratricopeptide (TPR) repeat protein
MKKFFLLIFSTVLVFSQFGCGGNTPANNSSNIQTPSATPATANQNANVSNANTVVKEDVPVPTFTDAETAFTEGNKYLDDDETEKSIEAFKQAVKLNPDFAEAYFKLGIAYALIEDAKPSIPGETDETEKTSKKGSKKVATKKIGKIVLKQTDSVKAFEEAVKAYKKILAKNPKDDLSQYNLGRSLSKLSEDEDAVKALREAIKLKPEDSEYQKELGATLNKLAKYDEAIKVLKKAQNLDPDNSQIEDLLGKAEAGKKRVDFGKAKNENEKPDDAPNNGGSVTKQSGGKSSKDAVESTPRDKREPPPKVETNEVKVKPVNKPKP